MATRKTTKRAAAIPPTQEDYPQGPRELVENLRDLIEEAEQMIVDTATGHVDETVTELREQLEERIDHLRSSYREAEERVRTSAAAADDRIRTHPYQALGIAAGVGLIAGLLLGRRK